jgi:hypothetical protein
VTESTATASSDDALRGRRLFVINLVLSQDQQASAQRPSLPADVHLASSAA